MRGKKTILSILVVILIPFAFSQTAFAEKYLVLLDSSDGMAREIAGERLIYATVSEVVKFIDLLDTDSKAGIMAFGHTADGCSDAELIVPFDKPSSEKARTALGKLTPGGRRGLISAVEKAIAQLEKEGGDKSVIFLVTSGWDECGGRDYYIEDAFKKSKIDTRLVIVGIDLDIRDADKLKQAAASGKGVFHEVENPKALGDILKQLAQGTKSNLQVIMRGGDPEVPNASLKIYDEKARMILSQPIEGFYSTDLAAGNYDIQLVYQGNNYWRRDVFIKKDESTQVVFELDVAIGELRIEILDMNNERMKGDIVIHDDLDQVVFEGNNKSEYAISLPEGYYSAEVTVGSDVEYFDGIEVFEEGIANFPAVFTIMTGTAEIVINNTDGVPVNATIVIENSEGQEVAQSEYASSYLVSLPPGDYVVYVTTRNDQQEQVPFYVPEGDNIVVGVEIESPMGSIYVRLVTEEGYAVYGRIRVLDERGREVPHFDRESIEDSEFTFDLPVGTYRIEAQVESVLRTVDGVTVAEGEENIVDITFPKSIHEQGF